MTLAAVDAQQPEDAYLVQFFHEGFVRRLKELNAFESVSDNSPNPSGPGTLVVTATLVEVDKGDVALRLFVGMGAGREHAGAQLVVKSADGKTLGIFKVRKAYSGGAGIGGASFIDIEDLTKQVGEEAAIACRLVARQAYRNELRPPRGRVSSRPTVRTVRGAVVSAASSR